VIGRDRELDVLTAVVDGARSGSGAVLLVRGEAGIGKSALLDWAEEHAARRGMATQRIAGSPAAETAPYVGLARPCAPFAAYVAELPPAQARALETALQGALGEAPGRLAVGVGVVGLLGRAAEERPLLVLVDDAHWLDEESLDTLLFAARRLTEDPIAIVAAGRPGVQRALERDDLPALTVAPLADDAADALVAGAGGAMTGAARRRLVEAGAGNPLALIELARALRPAQKRGEEALPALLHGGGAAEEAFARRIAALEPASRTALAVAAAEGTDRGDLVELALARLGIPAGALEAAETAELIERAGGGLAFAHPLCRAAAYAAIDDAQRRAIHTALAFAHGERGDELAQAGHLGAAAQPPDEAVAERLERAAALGRRRGAPSVAARAMTRAAELSGTDAARVRRSLEAAGLLLETEHSANVVGLAEQVLPLAQGAERVQLVHALGVARLQKGEYDEALALLESTAEEIAGTDPAAAARLLLSGSPTHVATGHYDEELRLAQRAATLARDADPVLARSGDLMAAHAYAVTGRAAEAAALIDRHADALHALPLRPPFELAIFPANVLILLERFAEAGQLLDRVIGDVRSQGMAAPLVYTLIVRAQLHMRMGRIRAAEASAREGARLAVDANQAGILVVALGVLAQAEALGGGEAACRRHAARAIEQGERLGIALTVYPRAALGWLELGLGRPAEAIAPLQWWEQYAAEAGLGHPAVAQTSAELVEALVATGRREAAVAVHARLDAQAAQTRDVWSRAAAQRAGALLLADHDGAIERLEATVAFAGEVAPLEAARARLDLGRRLRAAGRREAAARMLDAAAHAFGHLGATRWEQRARAEVVPGSVREPVPDAPGLTPLEERIAELAAQGMSNPEIGAELFFSRKTIERRMSAILAKLGLRSRSELPAALARLAGRA
jgi:DNA-binding NarL/FixJ family response regulator